MFPARRQGKSIAMLMATAQALSEGKSVGLASGGKVEKIVEVTPEGKETLKRFGYPPEGLA